VIFALCLGVAVQFSACGNRHECTQDRDCDSPETCIKGVCIDDSCPLGCQAGEFCSYGTCYTCNWDDHCGFSCVDCADYGTNMSCVYMYPGDYWDCGCYSDYSCPTGLCCLGNKCVVCP